MNQLQYIKTLSNFSGHTALYRASPPILGHQFVVIESKDIHLEPYHNPVPRTTMFPEQDHSSILHECVGYDHSGLMEKIGYEIRVRDRPPLTESVVLTKTGIGPVREVR